MEPPPAGARHSQEGLVPVSVDVRLEDLSDGDLRKKLRALGEPPEGAHEQLAARLRAALAKGGVPIEVLNSMALEAG